jgi:hypothetical protein
MLRAIAPASRRRHDVALRRRHCFSVFARFSFDALMIMPLPATNYAD